MSNALRLSNIQVSLFLNDATVGPQASHSWLLNNARPPLGGNLYNPTDQPITIVIPPKSRAYLPGLFANTKYANVKATINKAKTLATFACPIGGTTPVFNSGKPQT